MSSSDYIRIETKAEFLQFVRILGSQDPGRWESRSAAEFVAALGSWLEDADCFYRNAGIDMDTSEPSWQLFADMLRAATVYE